MLLHDVFSSYVWRCLTVDLVQLLWNFSTGCLHLDLCAAYIKLKAYVKETLKENEVKQQVSTRVQIKPISLWDCGHKSNSFVLSSLNLPAASQSSTFLTSSRVFQLNFIFQHHSIELWTKPDLYIAHGKAYWHAANSTLHYFSVLVTWDIFTILKKESNCPSFALTVYLIFWADQA